MTNDTPEAKFAFTKLLVNDLPAADAFYRAVCGFAEGQMVRAPFLGREIEEIIYRNRDGGMELVLLTFLDGPPSSSGDVTIAFETADIDAFEKRLLAAGGAIIDPIRAIEFGDNRTRLAIFSDLEGYTLEVIER